LPPVKLHCSLLAEDAIKKALENLKKKNDEESKTSA
jgi:nitrogen fixation NifU-like protein